MAQSPTASPARGGDSAAAGLTYPGPRPLSAPLMRPTINPSALNATSPILSGRRYEGSTPTGREFGRSVSLSRTAGASLAGTLMSYATRPGGTFDVFAAARDGQVSDVFFANALSNLRMKGLRGSAFIRQPDVQMLDANHKTRQPDISAVTKGEKTHGP